MYVLMSRNENKILRKNSSLDFLKTEKKKLKEYPRYKDDDLLIIKMYEVKCEGCE